MTPTLAEKSVADLDAEIAAQTVIYKELKAQGAPLEEAREQLGDLKKALALVKGAGKEKEKKAGGSTGQPQSSGQPKKKERLLLKTAKVSFILLSCVDGD